MPSKTKENYLKSIYFLSKKGDGVSVSELSQSMEVSIPTANSMVKKLREMDWVNYKKYKPISLTEKGRKMAALIIRKHRLAEMFLVEKMGFGWEEVHDIAEEMEHLASASLFERMDEMLGYPTTDPHGSPIPDKQGNVKIKAYDKLSDIEIGKVVRLCALTNSSNDFLKFLNSRDLDLGTEIKVEKLESFDNSMTVSYKGHKQMMLSNEVCERLLVEQI